MKQDVDGAGDGYMEMFDRYLDVKERIIKERDEKKDQVIGDYDRAARNIIGDMEQELRLQEFYEGWVSSLEEEGRVGEYLEDVKDDLGLPQDVDQEDVKEVLAGEMANLGYDPGAAVDRMLCEGEYDKDLVGFALEELKRGEEEEKQQEGLGIAGKSSIKKIVGGVGALALIGAGTATALSDLSGDGLATYRQLPIIGDVEGNPLEYDTSGDGIDDGTVHEMGLSPAESHPAVSEALKGGIDTDQARFFEGMNQRYVEEAAGYLAENPGKLDAVLVDGEASELGTKYAENFSPKALANLSRLGNTTGSNVDFAETLLDLPEDVHAELAEDYTEDGVASLRERNQAKFLNLLQENNQLRDFLQEYDPANANVSDDGFTNYFSLTRSDVIDWDVQNRRFVIDTLPLAADDYSVSVSDDFVERVGDFYEKNMRIPENQIYRLLGEDATWENFQKVTDELQGRMDEDDILVWSAGGEGSAGTYGFYAEGPGSTYGASYIYIDNELDEIPGKQVAVLNACFAGSAIEIPEEGIRGPAEPMADEDRTILASSGPTEETWGTFFLEDFYENMSKARGGIYPSFGEVFEEISDMSSQTPQIHNRDLAEELYLGIPGETEV